MKTRVTVAAVALPLLGLAWLATMARLVIGAIGEGLVVNANAGQGAAETAAAERATADFRRWATIAVIELAAFTVAAFVARIRWVGWVSLAVTVAFGGFAGLSLRDDPAGPQPRPTPTVSQCIERSGGDTRCPGG
ncbi:hypothetical protein ACWT_7299 [Actinoplanes sp. SE50]|uniref:hypothetical protein n=1 Tax=unclassified Actinoplanes TaxID=2626549 RepID=UPI00023EDF8F|nr:MULTISPECIES: hypothetical protein [unclassified Actinoplanes]AEV88309.1 hypothetical protein ACPL_7429 [Actinoplanes sp. SE50/110]ATO86714.1 hypothetical protein ACWT_7299 [Actinoplanes sp. SE50]SLM04132.1 hypothetical protein ACSP50_7434 [Actinoplanes sp. SE50/110]